MDDLAHSRHARTAAVVALVLLAWQFFAERAALHRVYLLTATVQWLAAMLHTWVWLRADAWKFQTL